MEQRKASDILLSIEKDLKSVLSYFQQQDFLIKTLANRISSLEKKLNSEKSVIKKPQASVESFNMDDDFATELPQQESTFPGIRPGVKLKIATEQTEQTEQKIKKLSVNQKIMRQNGDPITLANVDIYDMDQNHIRQLKTNMAGRWVTTLAPGNYYVLLHKNATTASEKFEMKYKIEVESNGSKQVEIDELIL